MTLREIATRGGGEHPPDVPQIPRIEQFRGCILGCALGDVIGAWAEARPADEARDFAKHFVRECDFSKVGKHHHGMAFGQYTDDTQLTRELMLSLIDEAGWVPEDFADRIARIFARNAVVGYGGATQQAAVRLLNGVPWDEAGTPPPRAGNGAAMRASPVGLFFWDDAEKLVEAAEQQASITHTAPMSVAAAVAVASATAMCLNASKQTSAPHEPGWWQWLAKLVERCNEEYADDIRELADMVFKGRKGKDRCEPGDEDERRTVAKWVLQHDDSRWSGVSPFARTSVLWSLYCLMAHPKDFWKAIELAVWVGGDSDTIAAMAGAMVGAHVGIDKFPEKVMAEVVPQIHDVKTPEYDWNGLDRLVYFLYAHVVERYNEKLVRLADEQSEQFDALIEQAEDEDEENQLRDQMRFMVKRFVSAKADAPEYVRTTTPKAAPLVEEAPEGPEDGEGEDEDEGGADILSMFGGD